MILYEINCIPSNSLNKDYISYCYHLMLIHPIIIIFYCTELFLVFE